jgi:cytochrome c-type biogenesis protein CcmE
MQSKSQGIKIGAAVVVILATIIYLAVSGVQSNKSYYVTISELNQDLQTHPDRTYTRHLRVAGNVAPGSIERSGTNATFVLVENDKTIKVSYKGIEPPPDTFKDNSQALAVGTYGRDGVFHATQLQAKCASKYAPAPGAKPGEQPAAPTTGTAAMQPPVTAGQ